MIITNEYFKGEIYIPHAKPGIKDPVQGVESEMISFINEYSCDCLFKCLGPQLYSGFISKLDANEASLIKAGGDEKWDKLLNGTTYEDPATGLEVYWKGIRYKNIFNGDKYDRSFLAYYTYFFYEKKSYITRAGVGHQQEKPDNAYLTTPTHKTVSAWNKFVDLVQGRKLNRSIIESRFGFGVDYSTGKEMSMYKFITDSNIINKDTYINFNPKRWTRINEFGI